MLRLICIVLWGAIVAITSDFVLFVASCIRAIFSLLTYEIWLVTMHAAHTMQQLEKETITN